MAKMIGKQITTGEVRFMMKLTDLVRESKDINLSKIVEITKECNINI